MSVYAQSAISGATTEEIVARVERLPVSWWHVKTRIIIGVATFFDAFDALAIASVLPVIVPMWKLTPPQIGFLISAGFLGQLLGRAVLRLDRREIRPHDRHDLVDRHFRGHELRLRVRVEL